MSLKTLTDSLRKEVSALDLQQADYADYRNDFWETYRDRGLIVLGVPSNDFGAQEPGSEPEIKSFCVTNYGVDFLLTAKQKVAGAGAHPFFKWIAEEFGEAAVPRWNFHKYLIDPEGDLNELWPSKVEPLAPEVRAAIEKLLPG